MSSVVVAGAALAIVALFGAASPANAETAAASGSAPSRSGATIVAIDDDSGGAPGDTGGGVNDQGQTSGDIFTQNAQDQSTA